jgi:hypothetical protein
MPDLTHHMRQKRAFSAQVVMHSYADRPTAHWVEPGMLDRRQRG